MKINFRLKLISTQEFPVRVLCDDHTFYLKDTETLEIEKEIDISPNDKSVEQYPLLEIQNLKEGTNSKLEIDSFCINSVDVEDDEMQDYFSLWVTGNKYIKDHLIKKVIEICFNGKLNLITDGNIRKFFWSPYYASRKRNDFVYDNRLACGMGDRNYLPIDEQIEEKVYTNLPHKTIDLNNNFELGCFGCSVTFGTGLEYEQVWPSLLSQNNVNFSLSGLGIDGIYLNLFNSLKKFKWQTTVIVFPNLERKILRFRLPSGEVTRVPTTITAEWAHSHFKSWAWQTFNRQLTEKDRRRWQDQYQKNFKLLLDGKIEEYSKKVLTKIIDLCEKSQRPFYLTSWDAETYRWLELNVGSKNILPFFEKIDMAKDNSHPGPKSHKNWADLSRPLLFDQ